jgi:hypothetical protein
MQRFGRDRVESGHGADIVDLSKMTQPGSRVCIATIQTMVVYSLSLAPLASFNRWRGWTTTGPFHQRMRCLIDLFAGKAYIPQPVGW